MVEFKNHLYEYGSGWAVIVSTTHISIVLFTH